MTKADDCETVARLLTDTPDGLTSDDIMVKTGWSQRTVNDTLCSLGSKVGHEKVRIKGNKKVTRYFLKVGAATG